MSKGRVVIAGGSGFLGRSLAGDLAGGDYDVSILTRTPASRGGLITEIKWDGRTQGDWTDAIDGAAAVINLTGKSVNCRYTPENRKEIVESRINSVRAIGEAIGRARSKPPVWVQAGSLAIYGDTGDRVCDENAPVGEGFSVETCVSWEKSLADLKLDNTRKVLLRIGFALGGEGGALEPLAGLARRFLGGTTGSGRQFISWLHLDDLNRIFRRSIERNEMLGAYNATGPNPVTNREFMRELRRAVHRPWSPPVPSWAVRIGARMMGTEAELALTGRRCIPRRLLDSGFEFQHPHLRDALADLLS